LNQAGHAVIHDKIVMIDPFSDNCVVVTGSHNAGYEASYNKSLATRKPFCSRSSFTLAVARNIGEPIAEVHLARHGEQSLVNGGVARLQGEALPSD
jgi:hypothetical protein